MPVRIATLCGLSGPNKRGEPFQDLRFHKCRPDSSLALPQSETLVLSLEGETWEGYGTHRRVMSYGGLLGYWKGTTGPL